MEYDVTIDRDIYIGGSDIAAIMGLSSFKTRWQLLLEKAGIETSSFLGNIYTEYGKTIEPQIRAYINEKYDTNYEPNRIINGDIRCHTDGFNGASVLEIKSTSHIFETVNEYKAYLVQLLKYMEENKVDKGLLAVYHRPEDFSPIFDPERLQTFAVDLQDYLMLLNEINTEIGRFRADLERLKENPLLSEEDFQPNELVLLSNKVLAFENQLAAYKRLEAEYKDMKQQLYEAMQKHDVKSWQTVNGVKITRVDGSAESVKLVKEFNADLLKDEQPELYEKYLEERIKTTSARAGYVKITLPK